MSKRPFLKYSLVWLIGALIWARFFYVWLSSIGEISEFAAAWPWYPRVYLIAWMALQGIVTVAYLAAIHRLSNLPWSEALANDIPAAAMPILLFFWSLPDTMVFPSLALIMAAIVAVLQISWRWLLIYKFIAAKDGARGLRFAGLSALLVIAAAVRVLLLATSHSVIGSEEAIMGLMARHLMLQGEFSVFLWGQPYMGSLEAIIACGYFFLLGASSITLKLVPFTFSIPFVFVVYEIGRRAFSVTTGMIAALIIAVAPVFLAFISLFATAYMENLFFCGLIIISVLSLLEDKEPTLKQYLWLGFICGLALWNNMTSIYAISLALATILMKIIKTKKVKGAAIFVTGGIVGAVPLIAFNLRHDWRTFVFIKAGASDGGTVLSRIAENTPKLFGVAKAIFGFGAAGEPWQAIMLALYLGSAVWALYVLINSIRAEKDHISLLILFIFLVIFSGLFIATKYGSLNEARYAIVLYLVYPVFFAAFVCRVFEYSKIISVMMVVIALYVNLAGVIAEAKHQPPEIPKLAKTLEMMNINSVYTYFWDAYALIFVSKERVLCASTYPDVYPAYTEKVRQAATSRTAVLFPEESKNEPRFKHELDKKHAIYRNMKIYRRSLYWDISPFPDMNKMALPE